MDVKTLLGLTSAIVGTGIVVAQDPSFEYPPVQPILTSGQPEATSEQEKKVTVRFRQASVDEVLDWLSNQGVSFVTAGAPKDAKITLSVSDMPLSEVIAVVGDALGGTFVKRGTTYIFQKEARIPLFEAPLGVREVPSFDFKVMKESRPLAEGQLYKSLNRQRPMDEKELKQLSEKMLKEFGPNSEFMKKLHQEMGDAKKWEFFHKDQAKLHEEMLKKFGDGSTFQRDMKVWGEQDAKKWEEFGKQMEKRFGAGSDFEKQMKAWGEKHGKEMELKFGPDSNFAKEMKAFKLENGKMRELSEKEREQMMRELEVKMKNLKDFKMPPMPKMPAMPALPKVDGKSFSVPTPPSTSFHSNHLLDVARGLSPAQRELNKKQGFLYWSDLTKAQQSKIGAQSWTGNWTITINRDGESFTLKSDKK